MKVCQRCGETYKDHVDFCFGDGEVLIASDGVALGGRPAASDLEAPTPRRVQGAQVAWIPTVTPPDRPAEAQPEAAEAEVAVEAATEVPIPRGPNRPGASDPTAVDGVEGSPDGDPDELEKTELGDPAVAVADGPVPTQNQPQDDPPAISVPPPSIKATPQQATPAPAPPSPPPPVRSSDAPTPVSPLRVEAAEPRPAEDLRPVATVVAAPTPPPAPDERREPMRGVPPLDVPPNVQLRAPRSLPPSAQPKSPPPNVRVVSGNEGDSSNLLWLGAMFAVGVLFALVGGTITLIYMAWWGGWTSAPATPMAVSAPSPEPSPEPQLVVEPAAVEPEVVEPEVVEPEVIPPVAPVPVPVQVEQAPFPRPTPAPAAREQRVELLVDKGAVVVVKGGATLGEATNGRLGYVLEGPPRAVTFQATKGACKGTGTYSGNWNGEPFLIPLTCPAAPASGETVPVMVVIPKGWTLTIDGDVAANFIKKPLDYPGHHICVLQNEVGVEVKREECPIVRSDAGAYRIAYTESQ